MILPRGLIILRQASFVPYRHCNHRWTKEKPILQTCFYQLIKSKSYDRKARKSLLPFQVKYEENAQPGFSRTNENLASDSSDKHHILLDPAKHADLVNIKQNDAPADSKSLQVSVVGIPNAGKSSLVNQLLGSNVCPHSQKVHTTRTNALGILTKDSTQVIIQDTPGVITNEEKIKFNLEDSLLSDPYKACFDTDLIIVVHDVSNRFVREAISKPILGLLCRNPEIPAILVLNKLDTIPKSKRVYDLIRKLTCGRLNGVEQGIRINKGPAKKLTLDDYFNKRDKRLAKCNDESSDMASNGRVIASYDDLLQVLYEIKGQENEIRTRTIEELTKGLVGWPGFQEVFTTSALKGDGIDDLRGYILEKAYPSNGSWDYNEKLLTNKDPRRLVLETLKSKILEVLPNDVPYKMNPVLETWQNENGMLKILASVDSEKPRTTNLLLNESAKNLRAIAKLTENDLQSLFQCEVFVMITVNVQHQPIKFSSQKLNSKEHNTHHPNFNGLGYRMG